tara:strand:- start:446 stop:1330 length:885 start_codon:yes stop_codon:yes gene_type:complete
MPEESKIDVGDNDEDHTEVDISPQEDKSPPDAGLAAAPDVVESDGSTEELEEYSSGVQGRISQLTKRFREEERQKQTALEFAENVRKENESLKKRMVDLDEGYLKQFDGRISSELETAKRVLRDAHETGDVDKLVEAQEALANLTVQKSTANVARSKQARAEVAAQPQPQPQQPQAPAPDPKAESWASDNKWFGTDEVMTYGAFGIHRRLVEDEGFDPSSDEYYTELNSRLRTEFPHKLESKSKTNGGRKVASAESSASRKKSGRKTVRLTPSQVAIAKKLNVPLEEYAKYVRD